MLNPPDYYGNSDSFDDLLKRVTRRVREQKVDHQIVELLQQVFDKDLSKANLVLSRSDRVRLFREVSKAILTDARGKIDDFG